MEWFVKKVCGKYKIFQVLEVNKKEKAFNSSLPGKETNGVKCYFQFWWCAKIHWSIWFWCSIPGESKGYASSPRQIRSKSCLFPEMEKHFMDFHTNSARIGADFNQTISWPLTCYSSLVTRHMKMQFLGHLNFLKLSLFLHGLAFAFRYSQILGHLNRFSVTVMISGSYPSLPVPSIPDSWSHQVFQDIDNATNCGILPPHHSCSIHPKMYVQTHLNQELLWHGRTSLKSVRL